MRVCEWPIATAGCVRHGWPRRACRDTLPAAPIERIAVLRLDRDMYESTMHGLNHFYGKLSPGGIVIIDDYVLGYSRQAVHDYRKREGITEPIQWIDRTGAFWEKAA